MNKPAVEISAVETVETRRFLPFGRQISITRLPPETVQFSWVPIGRTNSWRGKEETREGKWESKADEERDPAV